MEHLALYGSRTPESPHPVQRILRVGEEIVGIDERLARRGAGKAYDIERDWRAGGDFALIAAIDEYVVFGGERWRQICHQSFTITPRLVAKKLEKMMKRKILVRDEFDLAVSLQRLCDVNRVGLPAAKGIPV